jgi:hypothetical protein
MPGRGRVDRARSRPTITARIVPSARIQIGLAIAPKAPPDNHFRACPDCRVTVSTFGRAVGTGGCPTVRVRIVSATSVEKVVSITIILKKSPAPDNHFSAAPHGGVSNARIRYTIRAGLDPSVGNGIVSTTCVEKTFVRTLAPPNDHFGAAPNCRMLVSCTGSVDVACSCPTVAFWIISPAIVYKPVEADATPDNQFTACPHSSVPPASFRRVVRAGSYPGVILGIIPAAGIQNVVTVIAAPTPDDHFTAGPNRSVTRPTSGGVGDVCRSPAIKDRIVSCAVAWISKILIDATPDDHFAASPYFSMIQPPGGHVGNR